MYLLSLATRTIPIGTAYAVWVGIGAVGTAVYGMAMLGEDKSVLRIICFVLILAGIVGLKLVSTEPKA
jgi:quaternary ammonium compound-resistance protein SugE